MTERIFLPQRGIKSASSGHREKQKRLVWNLAQCINFILSNVLLLNSLAKTRVLILCGRIFCLSWFWESCLLLIGEVLGIDNTVHFPFSKSGSVWNRIEIIMFTWERQQSKPDKSVFHEDERREGWRKVELKLKGFEWLRMWEREYSLCRVCLCLTQWHTVDLSWRNAHRIKSKWFKCKATASGTGKIDDNRVDKRGESGKKAYQRCRKIGETKTKCELLNSIIHIPNISLFVFKVRSSICHKNTTTNRWSSLNWFTALCSSGSVVSLCSKTS